MIERLRKYLELRPILRKWIIAGLVIVLMTGLGMILSAFFMVRQMYHKEEDLQAQILDKNVANLNGVYKEVVMGAQTLLGSNQVKATIARGDATVEDRMRISEINGSINEYMAVHSSFGDVFLFFPSQKPMAVLTKSEYLRVSEETPFVSNLDMSAPYNQVLFTGQTYSRFKIAGPESDKQLYYSMSQSFADPFEDQDAVLLIKIQKSYLQSVVTDDTNFLIVTEDGSYIQLGAEEFDQEFITSCLNVEGHKKIAGRPVYASGINSYGINLIAILEPGTIENALKPFILGVVLYFFTVMIVTTVVVTAFMRRQYEPIEHLLQFMDERMVDRPEVDKQTRDEFKRIEEGLVKSASELKVSREEMTKFKNNNETRLVNLLNYGKEPFYEEEEKDARYVVISYDIDNPTVEPFEQFERDQVWFIIHNVSEELIGSEHLLATGGLAHWFYNIVQLTGENDITPSELAKQLNTVCSFIREKFDIALVANVSNLHHGKKGIPDAHKESMIVREYRIYVGALNNVAYYNELSLDDDAKETLTSWDQMEQVQNMYRLHRPDEANNIINDLVSSAIETAGEEKTAEIEPDRTGKSAVLAEKAKEYVDREYSNKDMNVNSIADELAVNNSYLSRTFKQVYRVGMLEYINNVRLDNAEKLMEQGATVKDAADRVGFSTPRPLIRCFRERHGITPGEYYKSK